MKKRYLVAIFTLIFVLFSPSFVSARNAISSASAPGISPGAEPMGKIILYDDYKIAFHYGYRVSNIVIEVCKDQVCKNLKEAENQAFISNSFVEFDLNPLLMSAEEEPVEYTIQATASFRQTEGLGFESVASLNTKVTIKGINQPESGSNRILDSTNKVLTFINAWILPGVYILLGVVLVLKGVMLTIDIVRYSDNSDIRREKLKAFSYFLVGVVCVAIINSTAGVITGLFR